MTADVALPLWLFVLILLFAVSSFASNFLFPSVRWFFRRRAERVVAELNKRLERPIQPFKLLRRQDMLRRVLYDPEVVRAATAYAAEQNVREDVAFEKAQDYAREIVPSFSATAYFGVAIRLARWLSNLLFEVDVYRTDPQALQEMPPDATVVFVINHRSNMDYVLVTYLAAEQSALSYAVGEWARVWPLSRLIRAMGAYFIRRRSRTDLYRRVLASYVQKATEAGVTQAVFPEGGLSRTGFVQEPKLGILSYIVEGAGDRPVVFVPVAVNYDRIVEDRILVTANREGSRQFRASAPEAVRFTLRYLRRRITKQDGRFGRAAVVFGRPISLNPTLADHDLQSLGKELTEAIRETVPVLPMPLTLLALERLAQPSSAAAIAKEARGVTARLPNTVPEIASENAIADALKALSIRKVLAEEGGKYRIADDELATFYANSIRHHLAAPEKSAET